MFQQKIKIHIPKWLLNVAIVFFIVAFVFISTYLTFEKIYQNKIYPGVWIGEINLKGKTAEQAKDIINKQVNDISQSGIVFHYQKKQTAITPTIASADGSFAYQIISFDAEKSVNQAYSFGRDNAFFSNLKNKIGALIYRRAVNLSFAMNEKEIKNILIKNFLIFETPAKNAELIFDNQNNFIIKEEKLGKIINYEKAIKLLGVNLLNLNNSPIELYTKTDYPQIYKKDCLNIDAKAKQILSLAPFTLIYGNNKFAIKKNQLSNWLGLKINQETDNQNKISVS
ncbi:MAG: peptidoglycan binding domain-containing protein, partial [Patescibacteria group bacterium]|nr:peptidoglycan binding domain-containing protein [Patescibacteria group bacterium]